MTDEKFEKAIAIKAELKKAEQVLNLLKGGCDITFKSGDTVIEVNDDKVREELTDIYSNRVDNLQREFGWL